MVVVYIYIHITQIREKPLGLMEEDPRALPTQPPLLEAPPQHGSTECQMPQEGSFLFPVHGHRLGLGGGGVCPEPTASTVAEIFQNVGYLFMLSYLVE